MANLARTERVQLGPGARDHTWEEARSNLKPRLELAWLRVLSNSEPSRQPRSPTEASACNPVHSLAVPKPAYPRCWQLAQG